MTVKNCLKQWHVKEEYLKRARLSVGRRPSAPCLGCTRRQEAGGAQFHVRIVAFPVG